MSPATRRILGLVVVAVLVAIGTSFAGRWQWQRADTRQDAVATLRANFAAEPVPLDALLAEPDSPLPGADDWRLVELQGRYAPGATVLLRNRPVDGTPAFHVLEPFVVDAPGSSFDGATLVVDRGWVAVGADAAGTAVAPAPPDGTVSIEVRLRPAERRESREPPAGQVYTIFPPQVLEAAGLPGDAVVGQAYGALVAEDPEPAVLPEALPVPSTDLGPHRSYALQWWIFAIGGLGGFGMLAVREARAAREERAAAAGHAAGAPPAPPRPERPARPRRRPSAEDEEDALIDAQLGEAPDPQASETSSR